MAEEDIKKVEEEIKVKLNELRNSLKEKKCYEGFLQSENLNEKYLKYRDSFYHMRGWKDD
ncbi:MAG: hypothetical protein WC556_12600 [Candidatus Methanoperedens sp.]